MTVIRGAQLIVIIALILGLTGCVSLRKKAFAFVASQDGKHDPLKITDDFYYVGSSDIAVYLINTDDGLVLFDTGYDHNHKLIVSNIEKAGFNPQDIKFILNTHAHMDHAGGIERMRVLSGAEVLAPELARLELMRGSRDDFSLLIRLMPFKPVEQVEQLKENIITLGSQTINWHHTPGHTKGCTTWTFTLNVHGEDRNVVLVCGFKILPFTKLKDNRKYPNIMGDYKKTIGILEQLKDSCDILLAPHLSHLNLNTTLDELRKNIYDFNENKCRKELEEEIENIRSRISKN